VNRGLTVQWVVVVKTFGLRYRLVADCYEHVKPNSVAMTGRELLVLCGNYTLFNEISKPSS